MLDWLPQPDDFKARLRHAADSASPDQRLERLIALSQHRLDFVQSIQVSRAMDALAPHVGAAVTRHRLAMVGSTTLEHLVPSLRVAALRRQLWLDVHCGGYGQYRQDLMDPASTLRAFEPHTVLMSLAAAHVLPAMDATVEQSQVDALLGGVIEDLHALWQRARDLGTAVVQQTFLNGEEPLFGSFDRLVPASPWQRIERLNALLGHAASSAGVALLDIARAAQRDGLDAWFDVARMLQAKQEIAPQAAPRYGEMLARVIGANLGRSKKCLVLDLDNTLWGGVLGDDGVAGLVLGQGSAPGEAHLAVQRYARDLKDRGVILAVCSKNDPMIAEEAFASHPEMLLRRSDIAAFVANWNDKADNLQAIAAQLNIGVDSLVLLDDNPVERARVRDALPGVAVPELPADVSGYVRRLAEAGYFEATSYTDEDLQRAVQYAQNAQRESLKGAAQSMQDFLRSLQMSLEYGPIAEAHLARATQLINKTNQFTPTTRRYSTEEVVRALRTPGALHLQFRLQDRFGDNGMVSAMLMLPVDDRQDCVHIDAWVMSCRVFGRQLEQEAMNVAIEAARQRGVREIQATYIPTPRNGVIRDLFASLGFRALDGQAGESGTTRWVLPVAKYQTITTFIARDGCHP